MMISAMLRNRFTIRPAFRSRLRDPQPLIQTIDQPRLSIEWAFSCFGVAERNIFRFPTPEPLAARLLKANCQAEAPASGGFSRGQGRRRSVDLWFFRPALYQLSYLTLHNHARTLVRAQCVAGATGFEPATSGLTGRRELQTSPRPRGAPKGIRIPVAALKGRSPRPLDDGGPAFERSSKESGSYTVVASYDRASRV